MSGWEVRVWWTPAEGATSPKHTTHTTADENQAIDEAVSVLDGCRHPWSPVTVRRVEIRAADGEWRRVGTDRPHMLR